MKKFFSWMLMAAVVLGLGVSVTSCSDDDDDNKNEPQKKDDVNKLDTDDARVAFRWLCVLADVTTLDEDWESKTYEPTVGVKSDNNEFTRLVIVSDLNEAKNHFSKFTDLRVDQLGVAQTVNGGTAGSLTWTPSKEGAQNLAVVEVSSRIMPHLQKIVYCTAEQTGQNGLLWDSMKGVAYYRLGDVIRDPDGYYWVCVRPSFAPDKGDSHWINIFNASTTGEYLGEKMGMPKGNICEDYDNKKKYDYKTIKLPTQLAYDREHIYNLNNLLWAMLNPDAYRTTTEKVGNNGKGLGGFDYGYHGENYVKLVGQYWDEVIEGSTIWQKLFNRTGAEMKKMQTINFFYCGYKWWWGNTADMWRYQSKKYLNTYAETGSMSDDKEDIDVVTEGFDITRFTSDPSAKSVYMSQFGQTFGNWVIRYKRGDKLSNTGKYDPYNKIAGCTDVYRFNKKRGVEASKTGRQETESDLEQGAARVFTIEKGYVIGSDGRFYYDANDMQREPGINPVAIVVCVRKPGIEAGTNYKGLALPLLKSLETPSCAWGEWDKACGADTCRSYVRVPQIPCNGLAVTNQLAQGCGQNHDHPAAKTCQTMMDSRLPAAVRQQKGFSNWFMPSVSQWKLILEEFGVNKEEWNGTLGYFLQNSIITENLTKMLQNAGLADYALGMQTSICWSSTPRDNQNANILSFNWLLTAREKKNDAVGVLPVIAFPQEEQE